MAVVGSGRIARRRSVPVFLFVIAVGAGVCSIVISMPPRLAASLSLVAAGADAAAATMRAEALPGELRRTGVSLVEVLDEALRCRSDGVSQTVAGFIDKASPNVSCQWVAAATAVIVISSACCAVHCVAVAASLPRCPADGATWWGSVGVAADAGARPTTVAVRAAATADDRRCSCCCHCCCCCCRSCVWRCR